MKHPFPRLSTLRFIFIAVVFMLLADHFIFSGKRSYIEEAKRIEAREAEMVQPEPPKAPPVRVTPPDGKEYFEAEPVEPPVKTGKPPALPEEPIAKAVPDVVKPHVGGRMKIAIIIDDLGMDVKHSRQVLDLPAPVTLAFLPYGTKTREFAKIGKEKGHHLIIHAPMEAMDGKLNIGPGGLKAAMAPEELDAAFAAMLTSFDGYEGINNHMGSRLTQDKAAMDRVMKVLKAKGLYFVDSKTIQSSVATSEARDDGVPYAERDVFLDHVETPEFVRNALAQAEHTAKKKGYAIAIGHPKSVTIDALKEWIPTLKAKGIELVPVKDLLIEPAIVQSQAAP